jgi:hypothetical protein
MTPKGGFAVVFPSYILKESDVKCVVGVFDKPTIKGGVEFLSLPPLYGYRRETQLSIRTVVDSRRI